MRNKSIVTALKIRVNRVLDGVGTTPCTWPRLAGNFLRLPKIENVFAVGIEDVVGLGDSL